MGSTTSSRRRYAPRVPAAQRREQLLDGALAIVLADGFHAVTMDGVARACEVTRPVVYGQFADVTALLAALLDRSEARALTQLARAVPALPGTGDEGPGDDGPDDDGPDPEDLLVDGVTAFLHAVRDDPGTWTVLLLPPQGAPPQLRERVAAKQRLVLGQLRDLVAWGVRRRGDDELDVDLFARSVHALAEGAARLLLTSPDRFPVERIEGFVRVLVRRLGPI